MPLYNVLHAIPLTDPQKDALAKAITDLHSSTFTTPRNFVQLNYRDVSAESTYIGGQRYKGNHIHANVRTGPSRSQAEWNALCREMENAWDRVVIPEESAEVLAKDRVVKAEKRLRSVIILGGMAAGLEAGFVLPPAGGDVAWMRDNWEEFERRANAGDQEMKEMVEEIKERGLMEGEQGALRNAAKKLEDMLGWGDAA